MGRERALASGVVRRTRREGGGKGNGSCILVVDVSELEGARLACGVWEGRYRYMVVGFCEVRNEDG